MAKAIILLFITIIVTYFAKFHSYSVEPVREHENLGWILPKHNALSFLFVTADDGIDTNNTKTGYRIWFNPPKQPKMLSHGEKAPFSGPKITLIGDSISLEAIAQISNTITDGGVLHIIGQQIVPDNLLKKQNDRILITTEQILNDTIALPMGEDISNTLIFDSLGRYTATLSNDQYHYRVTNTISPFSAPQQPGISIHIPSLTASQTHQQGSTHLYRNTTDTITTQDSTSINIYEDDRAAIFYEDKNFGENRLLIRKIQLTHWRAESQ
jgi:hypothetical protein